jgi:hypothetical protein
VVVRRKIVFMKLSERSCGAIVAAGLLACLILAGCSQREGPPAPEDNVAGDQHLPFEGTSDSSGIFPTSSLTPTALPAGTPLTVHLKTSASSATARPGDSFEAVLDEPIIVHGQTVAPRGAAVLGKILDARPSNQLQDPGYMRLALTAISLNGKSVPILTSSIFVKRGSHGKTNPTVISGAPVSKESPSIVHRNDKGTLIDTSTETGTSPGTASGTENRDVDVAPERRLTFRLAHSLPLGT